MILKASGTVTNLCLHLVHEVEKLEGPGQKSAQRSASVLLLLTPVPVRRSSWPIQARRAGKEVWVQFSSGEVNTKIIVVSELRVERPSPGVASGLTAVVQLESWGMLHSFS